LVHIKKLEIYGFKSFGFKNTVVNFEKGLVAVTGPNGSGKSNVLDAILFAIGENSPKALRVDKFQSLFHDSQKSSHRFIRVSLTFDNADRGIPIDSDSATLTREMEGETGDSQYYLNSKKVSKITITELLEIVVAAPNKINVVQQGMITRISELNSEERRRIIEDIVGLSYFDEKKVEALEQLNESDLRLEVALARMGEIRKRIDELEVERNDQLRYQHLESELKRFKAVWLSNNIRSTRNKLNSQNEILSSNVSRSSELSEQLEEIRSKIEKLETDKTEFIQRVDAENKSKAEMGSRITTIVYESERLKAMHKESLQRLAHIEKRIPLIDADRHTINEKLSSLYSKTNEKKTIISDNSTVNSSLRSELNETNSRIDIINSEIAKFAGLRNKLESRYKQLSKIKHELDVSIVRLEEKIKVDSDKIELNETHTFSLKAEIDKNEAIHEKLIKLQHEEMEDLDNRKILLENSRETKMKIEKELATATNMLERADNLALKCETRVNIAKEAVSEDLAIAELMKDPSRFGIIGLAYDILRWDKSYERAILAAASEWMKAFIVDNIKSMILIAEYAKLKKLPCLKIISLDIIVKYGAKKSKILLDDVNTIGNLSDFVYSDYKGLSDFLFGDTFLVKSTSSAYILSKQGYRAVSVDGILFEPQGRSLSIDFGSKISDLTRAILVSNSVDNLKSSITTLKELIKHNSWGLNRMAVDIDKLHFKEIKSEAQAENFTLQISSTNNLINETKKTLQQTIRNSSSVQLERDSILVYLENHRKRKSIIELTLERITERLQSIDDNDARNALERQNFNKIQILKSIEGLDIDLREVTISSATIDNEIEMSVQRLKTSEDEKEGLRAELDQRRSQVDELQNKLQSFESELKALRDQEQQVIISSGNSYGILQNYEQEIKQLREIEKKVSKEFNAIEKETVVLRRDIYDITSQQSRLANDLLLLGYKDLLEEFEVDDAIRELTDEFETLKTKINLRADETYNQIIEGYRNMSSRHNQLETERNSIILFIEEVIKEKKNVFMDAFRKVDNDIRKTFSEVVGGQAWLEIEDLEDVFTSGIMLMVQFPGKPARESTALSGGEKTMAATIFLLALQSLKPSPFYLMDEVDAHLDAENNERLSRILLSRSRDNQIIIVSLKDTTVAKASMIYGVYPKEGVSQIVKYKRANEEAIAEINRI
jgi:chromosome segregation protein